MKTCWYSPLLSVHGTSIIPNLPINENEQNVNIRSQAFVCNPGIAYVNKLFLSYVLDTLSKFLLMRTCYIQEVEQMVPDHRLKNQNEDEQSTENEKQLRRQKQQNEEEDAIAALRNAIEQNDENPNDC